MAVDIILYIADNNNMDHQFVKISLGLSPFDKHVITHYLRYLAKFRLGRMSIFFQNTLKKSAGNLSATGLLPIFIVLSVILSSFISKRPFS